MNDYLSDAFDRAIEIFFSATDDTGRDEALKMIDDAFAPQELS